MKLHDKYLEEKQLNSEKRKLDMLMSGNQTSEFLKTLDSNIKIIDSPGMRDIAIENYSEREIINGFEEIHNASKYCKFNNCNHIDNEGCNITKKLLNDEINESRYNNFIKFLNIK